MIIAKGYKTITMLSLMTVFTKSKIGYNKNSIYNIYIYVITYN